MDPTAESTVTLLARARGGDEDALNHLFARYEPILRRWARGRLPRWARDLADTPDLVQDTLLQTFKNLKNFDDRGDGALHAYLRQAVMNRIRDEFRRTQRRRPLTALDPSLPDGMASPLEEAIGAEALARYETALATLTDDERELVVARVELGLTYGEIAASTGRPTPNAARMAVSRALLTLAGKMDANE